MGATIAVMLPIQPLHIDTDGVTRFVPNAIVKFLLDWAKQRGMDLNALAIMPFTNADREQFAQLIGYSLCGFGDLSYVSDETYQRASDDAQKMKGVPYNPIPKDPSPPTCQHEKCFSSIVLTSNPPRRAWICRKCGECGTDLGTSQPSEYEQLVKQFATKKGGE